MRLRFAAVFLMMILLLFPLCCAEEQRENTDLLIMVYMSGGDLESLGGSASRDLREMAEALGGNEHVRVAVMLSGARKWHSEIPARETSVFEISGDGLHPVRKMELMSMGDASTLSCFLNVCAEVFQADRYGLILWDHGAGPLAGISFDELFVESGEQDRLDMGELKESLEASAFSETGLSFIGFDACLMSSMEVAWTVRPFTGCMIASEEKEWSEGWDYGFLRHLTGTESGKEIGEKILESYRASVQDCGNPVTLSVLDLAYMEDAGKEMDAFFRNIAEKICPENYRDYAQCRALAKMPGGAAGPYFDLVDLCDLIGLFEEKGLADGSRILSALHRMIAAEFSLNDDYVSGISVYAPFDNKHMYVSGWSKRYGEMDFAPGYQAFVKKLSDLYMGESLFQWKSGYQTQIQEEAGSVRVKVELSPEEMENIARARLIVVEDLGDGTYQQVYADTDGLRMFEDAVTARYHGESLYQVDAQGNILAGPLTYYPVEDGIALQGILYYPFDMEADFRSQKMMDAVEVIYRKDEQNRLTFSEVLILAEPGEAGQEDGMYLRSSVSLADCESLELYSSGPSGNMDGIRDTGRYELTGKPVEILLENGIPKLQFLPVYHRHDRYAYLRLTDLQGNTFCSDVVQIPNPTVIPLSSKKISAEKGGVSVTCDMLGLVTGYAPGILVDITMENHSEEELITVLQSAKMNGIDLGMERNAAFLCPAGETSGISAFIPAGYVPGEAAEQMEITIEGHSRNGTAQTWNLIIPLEADFSMLDSE